MSGSNGRGPDAAVPAALPDERVQLVLESSADVLVVYDGQGVVQWASPSLAATFGYDPADVVGTPFRLGPDDTSTTPPALEAAVLSATTSDTDVAALRSRVLCADGTRRWADSRVRALHGPDGSIESLVVSLRDVDDEVRAQLALAASERRFRLLAESASDVVYETTVDGVIVWMSPSARWVLGYDPDELVGTVALQLVHPDHRDAVGAVRRRVYSGDAEPGLEVEVLAADGTSRWVSGMARPLRAEDGTITGSVVGWRDIHEQVLARRQAQREAVLLQRNSDGMLDPQVLVEAVRDDDGRIVDFRYLEVNRATWEYLQTTHDELVGSTFLASLPGMAESGLIDIYAACVETGEPLILDDYAYTNEVFGEVRRYDIRASRVDDGLSLMWHDSTERHRAQRLIAASEARFRILADNATDVIFQTTPDRRIEWASPSVLEVLGWEPEEVVGRVVSDLVHPDDLRAVSERIRQVRESGTTTSGRFEARLATAAGGWRWMSGSGRVLRDAQGRVTGAIDALRDIESEHAAREAVVESELRYRLIAENASDVVFRMGLDAVVIWTSDGVEGILGWRPDQVMGKPGTDFIDPRDLEWAMENMAEMSSGKAKAVRMRMFTSDGGTRWIESRVKPVLDDDGQVVEFIGGWRDIEAEVQAQQELERRARTDDLTGLLNRGAGLERLEQQLSDPRRAVRTMAVAFCDIDEFKRVNDTMGHAAGDHLLRVVAERVRMGVREGDVVIRMGGDEVLVVLDGVSDIGAATAVAEKLRRVMAVPVPFEDRHISATMSIGVTVAHEDDTVDALVARADKAMYLAKQAGRDQVVPFE